MNTTYHPSLISIDHEDHTRSYDPSYHAYSTYTDYPTSSKLEEVDCHYWSTNNSAHNLLTIPSSSTGSIIDPIQSSTSLIDTYVPVHLSQMNSTTTISATHHHHHIHQHVYPTADTSNWFYSNEYPSPPTNYRPYICSSNNNNFYDNNQWSTPTSIASPSVPTKFDTPYSPPSYIDSSYNLDQACSDSKEEPSSNYVETLYNTFKSEPTPVPPKNPANGALCFIFLSLSCSLSLTFGRETTSRKGQ
jgi:hypothetical protein